MVPPDAADLELVRRTLAGETDAFARLVDKHQRLVFGVALSSARDPAQAEEVAQEAFVEAWRKLSRLRDPARVGSWIAGIARNLGRRWKRHSRRLHEREVSAISATPEDVPTPFDRAVDRETNTLVNDALAKIPHAYREALVLYYVDGSSVAQVTKGLGISEDLVKQRLSRGRRALRAALEVHVEDTLERLRPSKYFTAAVIVSVAATGSRKTTAARTTSSTVHLLYGLNLPKVAAVGLAALVVGGLGHNARSTPTKEPQTRPEATHGAARTSDVEHQAVGVRTLNGIEARESLLRSIRRAQEGASRSADNGGVPFVRLATPRAVDVIDANSSDEDRNYIRDAVRALMPMLVECYGAALEKAPTLSGALIVTFTIEGEPSVGALVTESEVELDQSDIKDPEMNECVRQTMFALEIDPPPVGRALRVTYPFAFWPKD